MLTTREVCARFGVTKRTVTGWVRSGKLPAIRAEEYRDGQYRYRLEDVEAFQPPHVTLGQRQREHAEVRLNAAVSNARVCGTSWCAEPTAPGRSRCEQHLQVAREGNRLYRERMREGLGGLRLDATRLQEAIRKHGVSALAEYIDKENAGPWEHRLRHVLRHRRISVRVADEICVALGWHLSWFDPYYWQEEAEETA